jgi:hypothetical protein
MAVLPCSAIGSPPPVITWYRDGAPVLAGSRINISDSGTLQINGELCTYSLMLAQNILVPHKMGLSPKFKPTIFINEPFRRKLICPTSESQTIFMFQECLCI